MRSSVRSALGLCALALFFSGCARQRFHPQALSPPAVAASLESRRLDDPGLKRFMETNLHGPLRTWPLKTWDFDQLTLAAYYFNPELSTERARAAAAEAAMLTAGMRPNPTLDLVPAIPSPYLFDLDFSIPLETHGKRGIRIERAKHLSEAARLNLANTAWKVHGEVRTALVNYFLAVRQLELLRAQRRLGDDQVQLLTHRLQAGEIARPEVDVAVGALALTRVALHAAEGQVPVSKAAVAAAIGMPVSGLNSAQLVWPDFDQPSKAASLRRIQRDAVLNRLDVRQALANYAAAESDLKLQIAKQYPDFQIAPGYRYEEQNNFFSLGLSVTLPIFNHNQGPIAEAEARRQEAAAAFRATQATVIGESEGALARYRGALDELAEANRPLLKIQNAREKEAQRAAVAGESDLLAVILVRLEGTAAATARLAALGRAQTALGELEDAVQKPLEPGEHFVPVPQSSVSNETAKGAKR